MRTLRGRAQTVFERRRRGAMLSLFDGLALLLPPLPLEEWEDTK
jgi:hypothetical protein